MRRDTGTLIESEMGDFVMSPRSDRATRSRLTATIVARNITVFGFFNYLWDGCSDFPYLSVYPSGGLGSPLIQQVMGFDFTGINPPGAWELLSGALPPGLSLDDLDPSDNKIDLVGTPGGNGTYTFRLKVANNLGEEGEKDFTMRVKSAEQISNFADFAASINTAVGTPSETDGLLVPCGAFGTEESIVGTPGASYVAWMHTAYSPPTVPLLLFIDPLAASANLLVGESAFGAFPGNLQWQKDDLDPDPSGTYNLITTDYSGTPVPVVTIA